jgi:hypothetical protein
MSHVGHSRLYAEAPTGEWPLDFCTSIIQGERISLHRFNYGRFARRV